jgi:phage terminase large subunit-like protein
MRLSKEDGKKGDGSNPSFAVLDEVHQMVDDSHYHLLLQGMATRKNTLLSMITTAGTSTDADNFCYREYQFACNLLNPHSPVTDDKYFAMICQLDTNLTSEIITTSDGRKIEPGGIIDLVGSDESILKTQVVTGLSETVRTNIADKIKDAQNKPENMKMLLTKTFNVFVTARGEHGFLDMSRWSNCAVNESELEDIINNKAQKKCFIGVDLSSKLSLSSVSFIFPYQDGNLTKYAITGHSFVPREEFTRKVNEGVPYDGFERRGDLTVIDGACIDHDAIHEYILGICREEGYQVQEICVDPWSAGAISSRLQNDGFEVVDIVQGLKTLSEPTKSFREMVYSNRIVHANNAVINYCMSNAIVKQDHNQNIMICKKTSKARVDALSATLNAMVRALTAEVSNQETMSFGVMFV